MSKREEEEEMSKREEEEEEGQMSLLKKESSAAGGQPKVDIVFSDIDGTCVHYDVCATYTVDDGDNIPGMERAVLEDGSDVAVLRLPPSSSGSRGVISCETLRLYGDIRKSGAVLVLISGCRSSTLLQRLPYLPKADAYVCESGGQIYLPDGSVPTGCGLRENVEWRNSHPSLPPRQSCDVNPEDRGGVLWEYYRQIRERVNGGGGGGGGGLKIDCANYSTAFRVGRMSGKGSGNNEDSQSKDNCHEEALPQSDSLPAGLSCATNLGSVDIYPSTSGKKNAAAYLMKHFNTEPSRAVFLCGASSTGNAKICLGCIFCFSVVCCFGVTIAITIITTTITTTTTTTTTTTNLLYNNGICNPVFYCR